MSLYLTNEELLTVDLLQMNNLQRRLMSEGWSIEHRFSSPSWARVRFTVAMSREVVFRVFM